MPFNTHTEYQTPVYFAPYAKSNDRALQELPYGNLIVNVSYNSPLNSQKKVNVPYSSNTQNQSKPKIRYLSRKSASGKLFSKAKFISDSKRQTFLSQSPNSSDRNSSSKSETKKIRFLRVSKPSISKKQSPKKRKSAGVQIQVISEYYIQPENDYSEVSRKNLKYISKKVKSEETYKVDYQDAQILKKGNMFTSSTGQIILKGLVGANASPVENKSDKSITTMESSKVRKNSGKDFCMSLPKVVSFEMEDGTQISKITPKDADTSFFHEIKDEQKAENNLSSFSRLILKEKRTTINLDDLNSSICAEESELGELSLMSRN